MYIPKYYEMTDEVRLIAFMKEYSFGILFSQHGDKPHGTLLPFLYEPGEDGNQYLIGHMARANPQWKEIAEKEVLVAFWGPHSYVSPSWYEEKGFVPTWDYMAVHVTGEFNTVDDADQLRSIMEKTIVRFEAPMPNPWDGAVPDEIYQRLIKGVVGFKIKITAIEGQWKLHQDHSTERKQRVVRYLKQTNDRDALKIAAAIQEINGFQV